MVPPLVDIILLVISIGYTNGQQGIILLLQLYPVIIIV